MCSAMSHKTPAWILRIPQAEGPPIPPKTIFGFRGFLGGLVDADELKGAFPD